MATLFVHHKILISMFGILALASVASAYNATANDTAHGNTTVTERPTVFTTYCPEPTTFTYGNQTLTVTAPTTLTITDCGPEQCTPTANRPNNGTINGTASATSAPGHANGVSTAHVGAAVAAVGMLAYLL